MQVHVCVPLREWLGIVESEYHFLRYELRSDVRGML